MRTRTTIFMLFLAFAIGVRAQPKSASPKVEIGNGNTFSNSTINQGTINNNKYLTAYNTCIKYETNNAGYLIYPMIDGMIEAFADLQNTGMAKDSVDAAVIKLKELKRGDFDKKNKVKIRNAFEQSFRAFRLFVKDVGNQQLPRQEVIAEASALLNELTCNPDDVSIKDLVDDELDLLLKEPQTDASALIIYPLENGYSRFRIRNKWGLCDALQKVVLEPIYDSVYNPSYNYVLVRYAAADYEYISLTGNKNVRGKYVYAAPFSEGYACVSEGQDVYRFINTQGIALMYSNSTGKKIVLESNEPGQCRFGLIPVYQSVYPSNVIMYGSSYRDFYYSVNNRKVVWKKGYTGLKTFNECGIAIAYVSGDYKMIDTTLLIVMKQDAASITVYDDAFVTEYYGHSRMFNKCGRLVTGDKTYHNIYPLQYGVFGIVNYVQSSDTSVKSYVSKYGLLNDNGVELLPISYDKVGVLNPNYIYGDNRKKQTREFYKLNEWGDAKLVKTIDISWE